MSATVLAVSKSPEYTFQKPNGESIRLLAGLGVEGDVHMGEKVKHRSRMRQNPNQPNPRQVHLIHSELHDELYAIGFNILPGQMGENVNTKGIDILNLPQGAKLHLGQDAIIEVTGLRNPCEQLDNFQNGLLKVFVSKDADGNIICKAEVMSVVLVGGEVYPGDSIDVEYPPEPHIPLEKV